MKNILFLFLTGILCLLNSISFAQAPEKFNYQAVIRDNTGELIINQTISVRIAIIDNTSDGTTLYREIHSETTSDIGLVNLQIGSGTGDIGVFSDIDWGTNPKYLQIEIDASGGTSYTDLGTFQLLSVPYALYANNVANKDDADADSTNEIQNLDLTDDVLTITNHPSPTEIDLAPFQGTNTDEQELSLTGTDLSITGGNTVDLVSIQDGVDDADADPLNEIQNLLLAGDTLEISDGNQIVLPYDSSNWVINGNTMYYNGGNVGIGSSTPVSNLEVKDNNAGSDALFQVINANNDTVFAVYPDGVKVFIDPEAKGRVGGFAISGRSPSKAGEVEYMRVTTDSTRIYVNEPIDGKGRVGGFAISGRSPSKGIVNDYLVVTGDSTRIYVNDSLTVKGRVGGFAISGRSPSKGTINDYLQVTRDSTRVYVTEPTTKGSVGGFAISGRSPSKGVTSKFMDMTKENYFIGHESGQKNNGGLYNSFMGYESGFSNILGSNNSFIGYRTGYNNSSGSSNTFLGDSAGFGNIGGSGNLFVGKNSGIANEEGNNNSFIGSWAGINNITGLNNSFIGSFSGYNNSVGSYNTFIGDSTGYNNISGEFNVYIGDKTGFSNNGHKNVIIGYRAGYNSSTTDSCVFIGNQSGYNNMAGSNTFLGDHSGYSNSTGQSNTFIGKMAGHSNITGSNNSFLGFNSGYSNSNGSGNLFIGYRAGYNEIGSNLLYIDNTSTPYPLIWGSFVDNELKFNANVGIGVNPVWSSKLYVVNENPNAAIYASVPNGGWAIYANAGNTTADYAGYFIGNVSITGSISKGSGSFKIDHPLDPENKYLYHSFVESPDMMNIYNGNAILDFSGKAIITLPGYFEALNMEFRYQLTAIGAPGPNLYIAEEISGNSFKIAGGTSGMKVSWQVTGIRHDKYAVKNPITVEVDKSAEEKGLYLHPDVFGKSEEKGIDYKLNNEMKKSNLENQKP